MSVPLGPGAVHDLEAMRRGVTPATKAIMLCTPNKPTGPALQHQQVIDFIDSVPDHIMIVVDEASAAPGYCPSNTHLSTTS